MQRRVLDTLVLPWAMGGGKKKLLWKLKNQASGKGRI